MNFKLITNLDFAGKLNACEAVTESGKNFLKSYKGWLYQNAATCGIVNGFVAEAQNYQYDAGVMSGLKSVLNYISENKISWKLASACESIANNNSTYNNIAKLSLGHVEKLLEMNESDIVAYIKSGALKSVQYIPEFRSVCREVYNSSVNEQIASNAFVTNSPVSFVCVTEGKQMFNALGTTYAISEGKAERAECADETFKTVNRILESFKTEGEKLVREWKPSYASDAYKFTVSESGLEFQKGNVHESFSDKNAWLQYADSFSKAVFAAESRGFMSIASEVAVIMENFGSIAEIDSARIIECADGTVLTIVEGADNVLVDVARSMKAGKSQAEYSFMAEALTAVSGITGADLRSLYSKRINEDAKKSDPEAYIQIKEQLSATADAQMAVRKQKIAALAEKFKHDPAKLALLNGLAKDVA